MKFLWLKHCTENLVSSNCILQQAHIDNDVRNERKAFSFWAPSVRTRIGRRMKVDQIHCSSACCAYCQLQAHRGMCSFRKWASFVYDFYECVCVCVYTYGWIKTADFKLPVLVGWQAHNICVGRFVFAAEVPHAVILFNLAFHYAQLLSLFALIYYTFVHNYIFTYSSIY